MLAAYTERRTRSSRSDHAVPALLILCAYPQLVAGGEMPVPSGAARTSAVHVPWTARPHPPQLAPLLALYAVGTLRA
jgi:hypothetical protein